jgi:GDP-L-fucose synthase
MENYDDAVPLNVGTGEDLSIAELAQIVARVIGYSGQIRFDLSRPDGTLRKLLDVQRCRSLGWRAKIGLEEGIRSTYEWYCERPSVAHHAVV